MFRRYISILFISFSLCAVRGVQAQIVWQDINPVPNWTQPSELQLSNFRSLSVQIDTLERQHLTSDMDSLTPFSFPMPDGSSLNFLIWLDPILSPGLHLSFPFIRTFSGYCPNDLSLRLKLDIGPYGLHGLIIGPEGETYLDPATVSQRNLYVSYHRSSALADQRSCELTNAVTFPSSSGPLGANKAQISRGLGLGYLKSLLLLPTTTAEFAALHQYSDAHILSALVTQIHRVNSIYERDANVRFLIADNCLPYFFKNPTNDPYSNASTATATLLAQENLTHFQNISTVPYDLSVCFSNLNSHFAAAVACDLKKSQASMGIEQKLGHPSDLIHLGHLLGHMLGCNHTANAQCGRIGSSAFEPGSGSSLMSSAGYCSPNIQDIGDAYFHIHNLTEIHHFLLNGPGAGCGDDGAISYNQDPVSITPDHDIYLPPATPIRLYPLTATDPDGPSLTYCWEQYNLGPAGHPSSPSGTAPIIRSQNPTVDGTRFIPNFKDLVRGKSRLGESLPDYSRSMRFRLTLRDNHMPNGGVSFEQLNLSVLGSSLPFAVTNPQAGQRLQAREYKMITWQVGETSDSLIDCQKVNIRLSLDSGYTFSHTLALNIDNDGQFTWYVPPGFQSPHARLMIESVGHYFFALSGVFELGSAIGTEDHAVHDAFRIYPNPVGDGDELTLQWSDAQGMDNTIRYEWISATGQSLEQGELTLHRGSTEVSIPTSQLKRGLYLLKVSTEGTQDRIFRVQRN